MYATQGYNIFGPQWHMKFICWPRITTIAAKEVLHSETRESRDWSPHGNPDTIGIYILYTFQKTRQGNGIVSVMTYRYSTRIMAEFSTRRMQSTCTAWALIAGSCRTYFPSICISTEKHSPSKPFLGHLRLSRRPTSDTLTYQLSKSEQNGTTNQWWVDVVPL